MAKSMKVTLLMTKEKAKVNLFGKMEESMMECGKTANNTEKVNLSPKRMLRELANGRMVAKSDGFLEC